MVIINT